MPKHYAVIGRIPGEDEDSCYFYTGIEPEDLEAAFVADHFEYEMENRQADIEKTYGTAVYINHILVSDSPITAESNPA